MLAPGFSRHSSPHSPSPLPNISTMIQTFMTIKEQAQTHSSISTPLFALVAVARVIYQRHREQLEKQRKSRHQTRYLLTNSTTEEENDEADEDGVSRNKAPSPVKAWTVVAEDKTKALALVFYPEDEAREEIPEENLELPLQKTLVLVIPGNPGNPYYYVPLMQELIKTHGRRHEVRCLSHAGHVIPWKTHSRDFTLQEQMDQKMFYVKQRLREDPTLRLVLIGHSIGSYIALNIAKQFSEQIEKLVLLQPTIMHVALSRKGQQFMKVVNNYEFVVMFVEMVDYFVPISLRRWLVRRSIGSQAEETVKMASLSLVNTCVIQNVLGMAANEMAEVVESDESLVAKHEDKTLFVYSTVDEWVPGEFMQEFQLHFTKARHRVVPHRHSFMMETDGSRNVAEHVSQWIGDELGQKKTAKLQ